MRAIAQAAAAAAAAPAVRTVGTSRGRSGGCSCGKAHRTHAARTQALSRTCNAGRGAGAQEGILDHVRTRLQTNLGTAHSTVRSCAPPSQGNHTHWGPCCQRAPGLALEHLTLTASASARMAPSAGVGAAHDEPMKLAQLAHSAGAGAGAGTAAVLLACRAPASASQLWP